jgi:DNA-binding LacI/PurR family transcriptional regulator
MPEEPALGVDSQDGASKGRKARPERSGGPAKPRIKDMAQQLGVSVASVSRALNDKPGVADDLRRRVLELAAKLDFAPNMAARSLNGARTGAVAFVVHQHGFPLSSDPFYFVILRAVERALAKHGYHVMMATVGEHEDGRAEQLRLVSERRVDGVILAGPDLSASLALAAIQRGLPVVLVDNALERTPSDSVVCDNRDGARAAVEHLLSHGYKRIAFVGGPMEWLSTRERQAGYEDAMREAHLQPIVVHEAATTIATGLRAGRALLQLADSARRPAAVFAVNDAMALGVMRAAREAGCQVPGDVAVVGFDDIDLAEVADPPLTTVRIAKELMGELAARQVLELIHTERQLPVKSVVATTLVVRMSCGCAAT